MKISVNERVWVQQLGDSQVKALCQRFRLDLQGRILGVQGDDLIKLQGKLEFVNELENFFLDSLK